MQISVINEKNTQAVPEKIHGIPMIPFGLLAGFMGEKEIRITELAEEGFCFRIARSHMKSYEKVDTFNGKLKTQNIITDFRICFYNMKKSEYEEIKIFSAYIWEITQESSDDSDDFTEQQAFYAEYCVRTDQEDYKNAVRRLAGEYSRYIRLKLEEEDAQLGHVLTGYPAEKDEEYQETFRKQKARIADQICIQEKADKCLQKPYLKEASGKNPLSTSFSEVEYAIELDNPDLYESYLSESIEDFVKKYWEKNQLSEYELAERIPNRLYIGNQFCHLLFPEEEQLFALMDKAKQESLQLTLSFSYMREYILNGVESILENVDKWCDENHRNVEILVNDWAMADIVKTNTVHLLPCLGTLLNKRKKDPRMKYKCGQTQLYKENNLNAEFYREYLKKEFGIERYEWESCGYIQKFPQGKNSLHFPFYQTNTSQYCPLHAICQTGDRGKQKLIKQCSRPCKNHVLLYPAHLNMAGRYNSLFGIDTKILTNREQIDSYIKDGVIDRLVWNFSN